MSFFLFISFVISLRIAELVLSRQNEKWLVGNRAVEYGKKHYPFIVALHVLFLISLVAEYSSQQTVSFSPPFLIIYLLLIVLKIWVILSLGKFWNTKIYRIPKVALVRKGPYKYFRHPNYFIVAAEIAIIPLVFQLYYTALAFSFLNGLILTVRIREENKALRI